MSHSPEPWRHSKSNGICGFGPSVFDAKDNEVISTRCEECRNGRPILDEENARRIVAAVNFCQHLPTDFLSKYSAHLCDSFGSIADIPDFYGLIPVSKKILDSTPPTS